MSPEKHRPRVISAVLMTVAALLCGMLPASRLVQAQSNSETTQSSPSNGEPKPGRHISPLPRGTRLILKGGSYQLVREYDIQGDRVRYYSIDRSQWEVIPTSIVDWDATAKVEAEAEKSQAAILANVQRQENEHNAMQTLDIDASLEVAPGIFLPPGEGLFVFDGKSLLQVPQAETDSKLSKTRFLERVLVPVPIISSRHVISIPGEHAKFRLSSGQPEFYLRTADARTPDVELVRTRIRNERRVIMNLDELMGNQHTTGDTMPMQRWVIAKGVFRYTLGQKLPRGEYVIAEILPNEGMSLYVWDFGVN
jgi:hypothetical protein